MSLADSTPTQRHRPKGLWWMLGCLTCVWVPLIITGMFVSEPEAHTQIHIISPDEFSEQHTEQRIEQSIERVVLVCDNGEERLCLGSLININIDDRKEVRIHTNNRKGQKSKLTWKVEQKQLIVYQKDPDYYEPNYQLYLPSSVHTIQAKDHRLEVSVQTAHALPKLSIENGILEVRGKVNSLELTSPIKYNQLSRFNEVRVLTQETNTLSITSHGASIFLGKELVNTKSIELHLNPKTFVHVAKASLFDALDVTILPQEPKNTKPDQAD